MYLLKQIVNVDVRVTVEIIIVTSKVELMPKTMVLVNVNIMV